MGLNKTIETNYRVTASYWKIGNWKVMDKGDGKCDIEIYLLPYAEKGAKDYLAKAVKKLVIPDFPKNFEGKVYDYMYTEIMKLEDFEGAIMDLEDVV